MKKDKGRYHSIRKPSFLGGKKAIHEFLMKHLVYPEEALNNKIEGVARVKCEISDKGKVLKAVSIYKLGFGLDEEAERLCLLMQFENTSERGLKIKHTKTIRIPFVLPRQEELKITYETTDSKSTTGYTYTIKI